MLHRANVIHGQSRRCVCVLAVFNKYNSKLDVIVGRKMHLLQGSLILPIVTPILRYV